MMVRATELKTTGKPVRQHSSQADAKRNNLASLAVLCGLACVWLCFGCSGSHSPAVSVPEDCQKWLVSFFEAFKAKDTSKIQKLVSAKDSAALMAAAPATVRKAMEESAVKQLQTIFQGLGDFRSYSVEFCEESTVAKGDLKGRWVRIVCETKCSKRNAKASFDLHKGAQDSEFIVAAWNVSWSPL